MTYNVGDTVFLHWKIVEEIGSGAYGTVYKLEREEFGEKYVSALKVIQIPPNESDIDNLRYEGMSKADISTYISDIAKGFMGEIKLLEQLKGNTNIVSYEDHTIETDDNNNYYTILIRMELLTPLKTKIAEKPLTEQEIIRLGCDVCNALELCEKHKIIHRDIKPDNIFVTNDGVFKIGDFGVARTVEKTVSAMSQKGTYSYMAPEVYWGREYNKNVDIYSLGIVLYQLLNNNRTPFLPPAPQPIKFSDRENATKVRMDGTPIPPLNIGNETLNGIVLKACAPMPEARFNSASAFKAALECVLNSKNQSVKFDVGESIKTKAFVAEEKTAAAPSQKPDNPISAFVASTDKHGKIKGNKKAKNTGWEGSKAPEANDNKEQTDIPANTEPKSKKLFKKSHENNTESVKDKLLPVKYLLLLLGVLFVDVAGDDNGDFYLVLSFLSAIAALVLFIVGLLKKKVILKKISFVALMMFIAGTFGIAGVATYYNGDGITAAGGVFALLTLAAAGVAGFTGKKYNIAANILAAVSSALLSLGYPESCFLRFDVFWNLPVAISSVLAVAALAGYIILCIFKSPKKENADV